MRWGVKWASVGSGCVEVLGHRPTFGVSQNGDALRPAEGNDDILLDDEAVRLRLQSVLLDRGRLTNTDVRRISGFSRLQAHRLMMSLRKEKVAVLVGKGRASHYAPGPAIKK